MEKNCDPDCFGGSIIIKTMDSQLHSELPKLLRDFVHGRSSEEAFAKLVAHLGPLVYQTAYRQSSDRTLAEDVTQSVFLVIARKAEVLSKHPALLGWVHQSTRMETLRAMRSQRRRKRREETAMKNFEQSSGSNRELLELLDESLNCLNSSERELVLMKYFQDRSYQSIIAQTGRSKSAEKMKLKRALEKMSRWFERKGLTLSITAIATALGTEMAKGAPLKLMKSISASVPTHSTGSVILQTLAATNSTKLALATSLLVFAGAWVPLSAVWREVRTLESRKARIENTTSWQNSTKRSRVVEKETSNDVAAAIDSLTNIPKDLYTHEELVARLINAVSSNSGALVDQGSTKPDIHRLDMILAQMDESELRELVVVLRNFRGRGSQFLDVHERLLSYLPKDWSYQKKIEWAVSAGSEAVATQGIFRKWKRKNSDEAGRWLREQTENDALVTTGRFFDYEKNFWEVWLRHQADHRSGKGVVEAVTSLSRDQRQRLQSRIGKVVIQSKNGDQLAMQIIKKLHDPSEQVWLRNLYRSRNAPKERESYENWLEKNGLSDFELEYAMKYFTVERRRR